MNGDFTIEAWALDQAHQIVLKQGVNLVHSAQGLDKKKTTRNSYALRDAIVASLLKASDIKYGGSCVLAEIDSERRSEAYFLHKIDRKVQRDE